MADMCATCGHDVRYHRKNKGCVNGLINSTARCTCTGYKAAQEPQESPRAPGRTMDDLVADFIADAFMGVLRDYWTRGQVVVEEMAAQAEQHLADWARGVAEDLDPQTVDEPVQPEGDAPNSHPWVYLDPGTPFTVNGRDGVLHHYASMPWGRVVGVHVEGLIEPEPAIAPQREMDLLRCIEGLVQRAYPYKTLRDNLAQRLAEEERKVMHEEGAIHQSNARAAARAYVQSIHLLDALIPKEG